MTWTWHNNQPFDVFKSATSYSLASARMVMDMIDEALRKLAEEIFLNDGHRRGNFYKSLGLSDFELCYVTN